MHFSTHRCRSVGCPTMMQYRCSQHHITLTDATYIYIAQPEQTENGVLKDSIHV